ncbi:hypothetical protein D5086_003308 [Populus alba]|uniref:Uncharacterized protein n=1 Tax=Populus alba TaxID=43335 RepID=A0ACC4D573_POPAL
MNTKWRDEQHPSFINFIASFLSANSFRLNFVPIAPDCIFNCGGLSVAFIFVTNWDCQNCEPIFSRVKKLKGQFANLYVVVSLPIKEQNDSFVHSYFKYGMELGKPTFVPVQDLEMGFEKIVKIAHSRGTCKRQDALSKLKAERKQSVQGMGNFLRVVTSIPGIDNHDANAENIKLIIISKSRFFLTVSASHKIHIEKLLTVKLSSAAMVEVLGGKPFSANTSFFYFQLNQAIGSIEAIAKASKGYILENTDLSADNAETVTKFFRDPKFYLGIENIGKGLIRDGTGFVTFPVKYQCVVFRPFKGEILEAVVTMVNKMGFFAEAGPVQIFVSNHLIPDDMEFQTGDMPNYTTSDGSVKIQKDSEVRLKIIGTRVDATEILAPVCHSPREYSSFSDDIALDKCDRDVNEFCLDNFGNMIIGLFNVLKEHSGQRLKLFCCDCSSNAATILFLQFCIGTIKDDFLGVINDPANA